MRVGVAFPHQQIHAGSEIREFAATVESQGFGHIAVLDHVLGADPADREPALAYPFTDRHQFHEPLALLAFLAGVTTRIGLLTAVLVLPQRQAIVVAKQAAEIDLVSGGGRLRLGLGTGWNHVEYQALGHRYESRGRMLTEQVHLMRRLWSGETVHFEGQFHLVDRLSMRPAPPQFVPLWFGGSTERAFKRAARLGDGFVFSRISRVSLSGMERIRELAEQEDRDPERIGFEASVKYAPGEDRWLRDLERWREAGGTHANISFPETIGLEELLAAAQECSEQLKLPARTGGPR